MTGTGQLLVLEIAAVILGACLGYVPGRILRRRDRDEAEQEGYDACLDDYQDVLRPGPLSPLRSSNDGPGETLDSPGLEYQSGGLASLAVGPPHPDWREQTAAELAPEALANSVPLPPIEGGPERDVPEPEPAKLGQAYEAALPAGLGHLSPYAGPLTPAQRRRDKHKQRGQYAPVAGWSAPDADMLRETWKPEGAHWLADWQIEHHAYAAAIDEEIAAWVERQRGWLAADRWDRGARRLGAVA